MASKFDKREKIYSVSVIAFIEVEPAVKYSFVYKGTKTRRKDKNKAELALALRLHVKALITAIRTIRAFRLL